MRELTQSLAFHPSLEPFFLAQDDFADAVPFRRRLRLFPIGCATSSRRRAVKFEAFFPQPAIERECLVYGVRENRWMWQKRWNRPTQLARE